MARSLPPARSTKQREAIEHALEDSGRPLSPEEVLSEAQRDVPALGLATVYRHLKRLVADGAARTVALPGEAARYERAGIDHHHHFQCTTCRRAFDVPGCVGRLERHVPPGFSVHGHEITLYGTCADCGPRSRASRR